MSDDIPQAWHLHFERKGIPVSYRGLGAKAGISHEAARRVVRGWSVRDSSVRKVADALGVDREVVRALRLDSPDLDVWDPPASASLLSHDEREALSRLITLITQDRKESVGNEQHPAATTRARGSRAVEATHEVLDPRPGEGAPSPRRSPRRSRPSK